MISLPLLEKRSAVFNFFLAAEIILLFAIVVSFALVSLLAGVLEEEDPVLEQSLNNQSYRVHFELFRRFISLPFKVEMPETVDPDENVPPLLHEVMAVKRIEDLVLEGNHTGAEEMIRVGKPFHPFLKPRLASLQARVLYRLGRYRELAEIMENELDVFPLRDRLFLMAAYQSGNQREKAFQQFQYLSARLPLTELASYLPPAALKSFQARLEDRFWNDKMSTLLERGQLTSFRREIKLLKNNELQSLWQAEMYYKSRQYARVRHYLRQVSSTDLLPRSQALLIKTDLRENKLSGIVERITSLETDAEWYKRLLIDCAGMLYVRKEYNSAILLFSAFLSRSDERESDHWRASWLAAWSTLHLNEKENAQRYLAYTSKSPWEGYRNASLFWLARFSGLDQDDLMFYPLSFYTIHAFPERDHHQNTHRPFLELFSEEPSPKLAELIDECYLLASNAYWDEARQYLLWTAGEFEPGSIDRNSLLFIESLLLLAQEKYLQAFNAFRNNFPGYQRMRLPAFLAAVVFPMAYESLIGKLAREHDLDPFLVFALVRQESFFNKNAVSPQNAFGLMQIIMPTARQVLSGSGLPFKRLQRQDLFDPELNVTLGCLYLKQMLDRYQGKLHLALAAYNAGPHRVDQWLIDFPEQDELMFIEQIPFTETRNYVKSILRNIFYYRFYYENRTVAKEIDEV